MAINPRTKNTVEIDCPYEVGDIYMTKNDKKPWDRWPGTTWYQIQGVFMLAANNEGNYLNDTWGGEEYHTLTWNEMPQHNHGEFLDGGNSQQVHISDGGSGTTQTGIYVTSSSVKTSTAPQVLTTNSGANWGHNNMPPYNTCYFWQRLT